ncbi:MAG: ATP-binding protein [Planctomycetota bacterium]
MPDPPPLPLEELRRVVEFCGRTALVLVDDSGLVAEVCVAVFGGVEAPDTGSSLDDWLRENEVFGKQELAVTNRRERAVLLSRTSSPTPVSSQLLDHAEQISQLGCFDWNVATNELRWSDGLYRIYGFDPEMLEPSFERFLEFVVPEDRGNVQAAIQQALETGGSFENVERIRHASGELRYLESRGQVLSDHDGRPIRMIGVCRDVTRRTFNEQVKAWQMEGLKLLATSAGLRSLHQDETQWQAMLEELSRHLGCECYALHALDGERLLLKSSVGIEPAAESKLDRLDIGQSLFGRCASTRRQVSLDKSEIPRQAEELSQTIDATAFMVTPLVSANQVLGTIAFFSGTRDAFQSFELDFAQTFAGILSDAVSRQQLEDRLLASQRIEAAGRLAGVVSHDFNNLLTVISTYAELLATSPVLEGQRQPLQAIQDAADRASELTSQLRMFGRSSPQSVTSLDINEVLADCQPMLRSLTGKSITLETIYGEQIDRILADRSHLCQVMLNLCANGCDAMPDGGHLMIRTGQLDVNDSDVTLEVIDSGIGMSDHVREMVFEPFFTTKPIGRGTGLGLSVVYGVVKRWGGSVQIESKPGVGTTVRLSLPKDSRETGSMPTDRQASPVVLLVEPDVAQRDTTAAILRKNGFWVVEASDGEQIAEQFQQNPDALLLADVESRDSSGQQLVRTIHREHPGIRILGLGGPRHQHVASTDLEVLHRPWATESLVAAVRRLAES